MWFYVLPPTLASQDQQQPNGNNRKKLTCENLKLFPNFSKLFFAFGMNKHFLFDFVLTCFCTKLFSIFKYTLLVQMVVAQDSNKLKTFNLFSFQFNVCYQSSWYLPQILKGLPPILGSVQETVFLQLVHQYNPNYWDYCQLELIPTKIWHKRQF